MKDGGWEPPASWRVITAPEKEIPSRAAPIVEFNEEDSENKIGGKGRWVPPASWNAPSDLRDDSIDWNIRITKRDTTFATITCAFDITAAELCLILGKKFFVRRDDSFQLYLRKNGMEWHLEPDEQPIKMEQQFFEALGYTADDKLEQQGRKDHGYLFSFIYSDRPHNYDKLLPHIGDGKTINVAGLNLETLPVSVFKQAHLIETLNMSRNPRIDFPLDFAETCGSLTSLNLSECEFNRAPRSMTIVETLQKLDLSRNHLDVCPASFGRLVNMVDLDLRANQLSVLPRELENLAPKLTVLNLSNNNFEVCPFVIFSLTNLKVLDVSYCRLSALPQQIQNLTNLVTLRLAGNSLTQLPNTMSKMILTEFDIRDNRIQDLSHIEGVQTLKKVYVENNSLSHNQISVNQVSITHLTLPSNSLTRFEVIPVSTLLITLVLSHNKLASLPDMFHAMTNLENLDLEDNHLSSLPPMKLLKKLKTLNLSNNELQELPTEVGDLSRLEVLNIYSNNLKSLPPMIWKLGNLVVLNANSNLIEKFPDVPDFSLILSKNAPVPLTTSLFELYLGDNNFGNQDSFPVLTKLEELRVLNLNNNFLVEVPPTINKLKNLIKLQLSGNLLTSIPDEIGDISTLRHLYLNFNKLVTLPAELSKLTHLTVIDVSHNNLKYNLANIQYEWVWSQNKELKVFDLSANPKLQYNPIKGNEPDDLFALPKLQVLNLNELSPSITVSEKIEQQARCRRYGSEDTVVNFGIAEFLGQEQTLSICDLAMLDFRNMEDHALYAIFEGRNGSSLAKYLQRWFAYKFSVELRTDSDVKNSVRRTFLSVNKDMGLTHVGAPDGDPVGCTAAIAYMYERNLIIANVGDTEIVSCNDGKAVVLTRKHDIHDKEETLRVRQSGAFISQTQKLNNNVSYTRAFGHYNMLPAINAAPYIDEMKLQDTDEFLIVASSTFWEVVNPQTAVDIARTEVSHPSRAAHRLRDFALSCGTNSALSVMVISCSKSLAPMVAPIKGRQLKREAADSTLARLEAEIEPPTGTVAIIFTDIKNSTLLWETNPVAMRAAIKVHNGIMRRCLRNIGGYEVKTEGDAFMVSFKNAEDALKWCLAIQLQLLEADWPQEILESPDGRETRGEDGQLLFKGLSVRVGVHLGQPVCEKDPVTGRMDYFGPPVNRAARVNAAADGGQIVLSEEAWAEISQNTKLFEAYDLYFYDMGIVNLKGLGGEHLRMVLAGKVNGRTSYYTNLPSLRGFKADEIKSTAVSKAPISKDILVQLSAVCARIETLANGQPNSIVQPPSSEASLDDYLKTLEIIVARIENAVSALWLRKLSGYTERIKKLLSTGSGNTPHFSKKDDPANLLFTLEYMLERSSNLS